MKNQYLRSIGIAAVAALIFILAGCSKSVKGNYACEGGIFLKGISLESGDKATVTGDVFGSIQQKVGTYHVDGDSVTITVGGQSTPFTIKGNVLDGGELGGKCTAR